MDLANLAERLEVTRELRPPHRHADTIVALAQRPHDASADKTGPAENRHQGF